MVWQVSDRGFSLVEVLIAAGAMVTAAAGLAQLTALSARAAHHSRVRSTATVLAADKIEQLADDVAAASPSGTLDANVAGFVDHFTDAAAHAGSDAEAPADAAFTRRWRRTPLAADPGGTWLLDVVVVRARGATPAQEQVRLTSIRTRWAR